MIHVLKGYFIIGYTSIILFIFLIVYGLMF